MAPARKRRKIAASTAAVDEITFDFSAREDYLTGFHKRKQARIKQGQEIAARKEREGLLRARADIRAKRKEELEAHVRAVNLATGLVTSLDEAGDGQGDEAEEDVLKSNGAEKEDENIDHEDEYVDEAKYTTVTVESVDITRDGFANAHDDNNDQNDEDLVVPTGREAQKIDVARRKQEAKAQKVKKKIKKQKFRYEGKVERRLARDKERSKNSKQAAARKEKRKR